MTMRNQFVPVVHGATADRPDELDTIRTAKTIAKSLRRMGWRTKVIALDGMLAGLNELAVQRPQLVFNLVEAIEGDDARAVEALAAMERLNVPHTGASLAAYAGSNSKIGAKAHLSAHEIPTPRYWPRGQSVPKNLRVIIKAVDVHGSLGMDGTSIVDGANAADEVRQREARFGGHFFAEEYIEGREFNVALIEVDSTPQLLPIQEIDFSGLPADRARIVDYAAKWDETADVYHLTPRRFGIETHEPELARKLTRLAKAAWRAFGMTGYARVDFRVADDGSPFVLEVNANPCLAPDAGFAAACAEAGFSYDEMIAAILRAAQPEARKVA